MPPLDDETPARPPREAGTRERILDAAERLFAEHGIDGVSIARITAEAGQRNASALQYHFGTRTDLIREIFSRRMADVNRRRMEMLEGVDTLPRDGALRRIAEALVLPFAEQVDGGPDGKAYVRFTAQVYATPGLRMWEIVRGRHDEGIRRIAALVPWFLAEIPRQVLRERLALTTTLIIHSLAERERALAANPGPEARAALATTTAVLIDMIAGMLALPASPGVVDALGLQPPAAVPHPTAPIAAAPRATAPSAAAPRATAPSVKGEGTD
ncbi:MAG: TetR/AcrR family transcriptional regulator [Alphaproteobacteria bacterium]